MGMRHGMVNPRHEIAGPLPRVRTRAIRLSERATCPDDWHFTPDIDTVIYTQLPLGAMPEPADSLWSEH
jgi:hypothetical protein